MPILKVVLANRRDLMFFYNRGVFGGKQKKERQMETQDLLRVINECEFIRDDIFEIKDQLELTKTEDKKIIQAVDKIDKAKKILVELFPNIESLEYDVKEDLEDELLDMD